MCPVSQSGLPGIKPRFRATTYPVRHPRVRLKKKKIAPVFLFHKHLGLDLLKFYDDQA